MRVSGVELVELCKAAKANGLNRWPIVRSEGDRTFIKAPGEDWVEIPPSAEYDLSISRHDKAGFPPHCRALVLNDRGDWMFMVDALVEDLRALSAP